MNSEKEAYEITGNRVQFYHPLIGVTGAGLICDNRNHTDYNRGPSQQCENYSVRFCCPQGNANTFFLTSRSFSIQYGIHNDNFSSKNFSGANDGIPPSNSKTDSELAVTRQYPTTLAPTTTTITSTTIRATSTTTLQATSSMMKFSQTY